VVSPWKNPLPLEQYTAAKVVVYAYDDRWIPIMYSCLADAIKLYEKGSLCGAEIFVFPPDLAPWSPQALNYQSCTK
jgi:hypothetical protein